jgi:hypothetical protein
MMRFFPDELVRLDRPYLEGLAAATRAYLREIEDAISTKPPVATVHQLPPVDDLEAFCRGEAS